MTADEENAKRAAEAVLRELEDRSGFDWWWGDIDEDTQEEIRDAIADRIREVYR